jgi:hypothetical protein
MPRLEPLPLEAIGDLQPSLEAAKSRMGFLPNSQLIMARRPEILRAFQQLGMAINGPSSTITQHGLADGEPGGRLRLLHGAYRSHRLARRHSAGKGGGTLGIRDEPALLRRQARRVIALFGFLNRFNDTMATELESSPIAAGQRFLAARGWTVGKHAR